MSFIQVQQIFGIPLQIFVGSDFIHEKQHAEDMQEVQRLQMRQMVFPCL